MEKAKIVIIDFELVKSLMKERGIDEKTMAKLIEVTPQTVKRFLNGCDQKNMSWKWLIKVSKALNVPVEIIIHKSYKKLPSEN